MPTQRTHTYGVPFTRVHEKASLMISRGRRLVSRSERLLHTAHGLSDGGEGFGDLLLVARLHEHAGVSGLLGRVEEGLGDLHVHVRAHRDERQVEIGRAAEQLDGPVGGTRRASVVRAVRFNSPPITLTKLGQNPSAHEKSLLQAD